MQSKKPWTLEQTCLCFQHDQHEKKTEIQFNIVRSLRYFSNIFVRGYNFVRETSCCSLGPGFCSWAVSVMCHWVRRLQTFSCVCGRSQLPFSPEIITKRTKKRQRIFSQTKTVCASWELNIFFVFFAAFQWTKKRENFYSKSKNLYSFIPSIIFWKIEILNEYLLGSEVSRFSLH